MKCSICPSTDLVHLFDLYDDRYGYPGRFRLYRCDGCGHRTLEAGFTDEELKRLYTDYYPRSSFRLEDFKPHTELGRFKTWLDGAMSSPFRWVPEGARVLDIGCGFGQSLAYLEAKGCEAYGVEADENILRVAERFGFKAKAGLFSPDDYEEGFFNYVTMAQVIEHMKDPVATLTGVARVLKPGGTAVISTPNVEGWGAKVFGKKWVNWHAPYHIQHFTQRSMGIAAEKAGLRLESWRTVTGSGWLFFQWLHLATYPKEGVPSGFWSPRGGRSLVQKALVFLITEMNRTKINHLITRLFDLLGAGDNSVFVLRKPT